MTEEQYDKVQNFLEEHLESFSVHGFDFEGNIVLLSHTNGSSQEELAIQALVEKHFKGELIYEEQDGD